MKNFIKKNYFKIKTKLIRNKQEDVFYETYPSYGEASENGKSYISDKLVKVIAAKGYKFKNEFESITEVDLGEFNSSKTLRTLVAVASANSLHEINVIDFGGGVGHHYFIAKKLLSDTVKIKWNVVETPELIKEIQKYSIANEELRFFSNIQDASKESNLVDLIYSNVSLCYTNNPDQYLEELLSLNFSKMYITNHPLSVGIDKNIVALQVSDLSTNGVGREIPEYLNITNEKVKYPVTIQPKKNFEEIIKKYGYILAQFKEVQEAYKTSDGFFDTYGYLILKN